MKKLFSFLVLIVAATVFTSCVSTPTTTVNYKLGETTLDDIEKNTSYIWYSTGYEAFPDSSGKALFNSSIGTISKDDSLKDHSVVMVIKPNCSCQFTQIYFPKVVKTLATAGIDRANMKIFVTDGSLAGIDDIKTKYQIAAAPVYIVLKKDSLGNTHEKGRIAYSDFEAGVVKVDAKLADIFSKK